MVAVAGCASNASAPLFRLTGDVFSLTQPPAAARLPAPAIAVAPEAPLADKLAALTAFVRAQAAAGHVPGVALAVIVDGKLAFETGLGVRRAGAVDPVTANTLFRVASTTKLVTAIALQTVVERGMLDLDRPAAEVVRALSRQAGDERSRITLRQALTHTAGLPDDGSVACALPAGTRLHDYFGAHAGEPLLVPSGQVYDYSNTNYLLAGAAIEDATGARFDDYVRDAVLVPAGMTRATFDPGAAARGGDVAAGHDEAGRVLPTSDRDDCQWMHPAGGLFASAHDYGLLLEAMLDGGRGVVRPSTIAAIETSAIATQERAQRDYGMGVFLHVRQGLRTVVHPGGLPGYSAMFAMVPERRFGIVMLANAHAELPKWTASAVALLLGIAPEPAPVDGPLATADYVGRYADPAGLLGRFEVQPLENGGLVMRLLGGQRGLIPSKLVGVFWRGHDGKVEYFVTRAGVARKLP